MHGRKVTLCRGSRSHKAIVTQVILSEAPDATGFDICLLGHESYFGLVFTRYVPLPPIWNSNAYFVALYFRAK